MMKSVLFPSLAAALALAAVPATLQAQTLIESFDSAGVFDNATGNDIDHHGATVSLGVDDFDFTEGSGALEITYNYSGNAFFEVQVNRTFAEPRDLTDAVAFQVDVKGNPAAAANLVWFVNLISETGNAVQLLHNPEAADFEDIPTEDFRRWSYSLSELRWSGFSNDSFESFNLSSVTGISIHLQQKQTVSEPGTAIFLIDNLVALDETDRQVSTLLEDFDYADTPALQAAWDPSIGSGGNAATVALGDSLGGEGGALDMQVNVEGQYVRIGAVHTFAEPLDATGVGAFSVLLAGDDTIADPGFRFLRPVLFDTAGNAAFWNVSQPINLAGTSRILLMNDYYGLAANHPQYWSPALLDDEFSGDITGGGSGSVAFDPENTAGIAFYYQDSNAVATPYTVDLTIDEITAHLPAGLPKVSAIPSSVSDWLLH